MTEANTVTVWTIDGRQLVGKIDDRSDERSLWLRREQLGIALSVPIAWEQIAGAEAAGERIDVEQLKADRVRLATAGPRLLLPDDRATDPHAQFQGGGAAGAPRASLRVRSIEVACAGLANLDHDVEPDGLVVSVAVLSEARHTLAVRGSLRARLYGERWGVNQPHPSFGELGEWTERVRVADFVDGAAAFTLPLRTTAPEWEFDLLPDAVLNVELGVFGQGNYSASIPVVIRPLNPARDALQLWGGQRFFPAEVHRGPTHKRFQPPPGRWMHWTW